MWGGRGKKTATRVGLPKRITLSTQGEIPAKEALGGKKNVKRFVGEMTAVVPTRESKKSNSL